MNKRFFGVPTKAMLPVVILIRQEGHADAIILESSGALKDVLNILKHDNNQTIAHFRRDLLYDRVESNLLHMPRNGGHGGESGRE